MKKRLYMTFSFRLFVACFMAVIFGTSLILLIGFRSQTVTTAASVNSTPVIIIDAGHGGEDGGTQSSSGILEKDINLSVGKKVNCILKSLGYKTVMVRERDSMIYSSDAKTLREKKVSDIRNRMKIIETHRNSVFLSIHQNYFTESKYSGAQVFYSPNNPESRVLADVLQKNLVSHIQKNNTRKIKKSGTEIYLLHKAKTPAVMVECGFLSNPGEALLLHDEDYQKKLALAITSGIIEYFKGE